VDTIRVDICYRPLRIAWAIRCGDIEFAAQYQGPIPLAEFEQDPGRAVGWESVAVWPDLDGPPSLQSTANFLM
jgi:hypothetical protein